VPASEMVAAAGPEHCGWESATMLTIGWPLSTRAESSSQARQFVRDPNGVVPRTGLHGALGFRVSLPSDAYDTGYRYGSVALYLSRSDGGAAAYLVAGSDVERWPRSDPMTLCA
jgi:hypothetical protein